MTIPKKRLLCAFSDANELSVMLMVLKTQGFAVFGAPDAERAVKQLGEIHPDLVLTDFGAIVPRLKQIARHVPVMLICDLKKLNQQLHCADALLDKNTLQPWELIQRAKIMSMRKRGPRKGMVRVMPPAAEVQTA